MQNAYPSLQPQITRTLLNAFLDPSKPLTTHYGAIVGLTALGEHVIELALLPNIPAYLELLRPVLANKGEATKHLEAEKCYQALLVLAHHRGLIL